MLDSKLSDFEAAIVDSWAQMHKKSALVFLVLLALSEGRSLWSEQLRDYIAEVTDNQWEIDDRSLHRALRRVEDLGLIAYEKAPGKGTGAERKVFTLTDSGRRVLRNYCQTTLGYLRNEQVMKALQF